MRGEILSGRGLPSSGQLLAGRVSEPALDGVVHVMLDADGPRALAVPALAPHLADGEPTLGSRIWVTRDDGGDRVAVGAGGRGPTGPRGPAGAYIGQLIWAGLPLNAEPGLLPCDGRGIASADGWPLLRARLIAASYPYGTAAGNPRIPDYRDRALVGAGPAHTAGAAFGTETAALSTTHLPTINAYVVGSTVGWAPGSASPGPVGAPVGGNQPHPNTQPSLPAYVYIVAALPA